MWWLSYHPIQRPQMTKRRRISISNYRTLSFLTWYMAPVGKQSQAVPVWKIKNAQRSFPRISRSRQLLTVDKDNNYPIYIRHSPEDGGQLIPQPANKLPQNCISSKASKYLYGYITKGVDHAMVTTVVEGDQAHDEITQYADLRSVASSEVTWHLLAFQISKRHPPVQSLRVHKEDQQNIVFNEGTE